MDSKRTKIVATISDKNCEPAFIKELFDAGMEVIRINSAHLDIDGALRIIKNTREVSDKIAILLDTKGPEIRTTVCDAPIPLKKGATINIDGALRIIKNTREVSDKIAILLDTKGPEIRTTVCDAPIPLKKGATINIIGDPGKKSSPEAIYVTYKAFSSD